MTHLEMIRYVRSEVAETDESLEGAGGGKYGIHCFHAHEFGFVRMCCTTFVNHIGSQFHENLRNVNLHRAGFEASAAQGRREWQRVFKRRAASLSKLWHKHRADRQPLSRADRRGIGVAVSVATGALIYRTDVETGRAAYASQYFTADRISQCGRSSVVE